MSTTSASPLTRQTPAELRCAVCGYGIVAGSSAVSCPMCGGQTWEPGPWRLFSRFGQPPAPR